MKPQTQRKPGTSPAPPAAALALAYLRGMQASGELAPGGPDLVTARLEDRGGTSADLFRAVVAHLEGPGGRPLVIRASSADQRKLRMAGLEDPFRGVEDLAPLSRLIARLDRGGYFRSGGADQALHALANSHADVAREGLPSLAEWLAMKLSSPAARDWLVAPPPAADGRGRALVALAEYRDMLRPGLDLAEVAGELAPELGHLDAREAISRCGTILMGRPDLRRS